MEMKLSKQNIDTVLYIASDVRSGSTLLDNLISNHPDVDTVGELRLLTAYVHVHPVAEKWGGRCTCERPIRECKVWSRVAEAYEANTGESFESAETGCSEDPRSRWFHLAMLVSWLCPIRSVRQWAFRWAHKGAMAKSIGETCFQLLDGFARVTGKRVLVDSSKYPQQLYAMVAGKPECVRLKLIHVVRDGRAVLYSKIKRTEQAGPNSEGFRLMPNIRGWCYTNLQISLIRCLFAPDDVLVIRYEDLCDDRERVMKRICSFLDLPFDEQTLYLSSESKHNIAGTSHRFTWDASTPITLDTRWRTGLSGSQRFAFNVLGGWVNRCFGYE